MNTTKGFIQFKIRTPKTGLASRFTPKNETSSVNKIG